MSELKIFENNEFGKIRTISDEGETLFVGSDIAKVLGYGNPSKALNDHCKGVTKRAIPTRGGKQQMNCISESDMYRLIVNSKLPEAEKFEAWVFEEVLPTIRKQGAYMTPSTIEKALTNPDFIIQLATQLKDEQLKTKALEEETLMLEQRVAEYEPKISYLDTILSSKDTVLMTQIAADYGMSPYAMNKLLHELGVQYKVGKQWILYQEHKQQGYTKSHTHEIPMKDGTTKVVMNTRWTQKGRLAIYTILKENGILPQMEKYN